VRFRVDVNILVHAVLMREHGVGEIMTADTDFRKFPFLTVTDPVHGGR
jgi:predicted nucleic acid-binding protein